MQFIIVAAALLTSLSSGVMACKCYDSNGQQNVGNTQGCCRDLRGVFQYGNDCAASSISEHLSDFRRCCGGYSDCDYPHANAEKRDFTPATQTVVVVA
ncbi:hypothetical protein V2A60_010062 [Cordyceps javanica]